MFAERQVFQKFLAKGKKIFFILLWTSKKHMVGLIKMACGMSYDDMG